MEKQAIGIAAQDEASLFPCRKPVQYATMIKPKDKILALLKKDPDQGLAALIDRYTGYIYAIIQNRLSGFSRQDVEECVSDVFYSVYQNRDNIDLDRGTLKAFICTVARNKATDRLRQLSKIEIYKKDPLDMDAYTLHSVAQENVQQTVFDNDRKERLLAAIDNLPAADTQIMVRKYYFGQSNKEIASALSMKENTVSKRAARAVAKLGNILSKEDFINE